MYQAALKRPLDAQARLRCDAPAGSRKTANPGHFIEPRPPAFTRMLPHAAPGLVHPFYGDDIFSGLVDAHHVSRRTQILIPSQLPRGSYGRHDNSLIRHGMALYEFREAANQLFTALYRLALNFRDSVA